MKQVLFPKWGFVTGKTTQFSSDKTHENPIALVHLDAPDTILGAAPTKDFAIMFRNGKTQAPTVIDVDYDSLQIVLGTPNTYAPLGLRITCPAGELGKTYTINFVKHTGLRHERNLWRISVTLKADCTANELAQALVAEFNKLKKAGLDWASGIVLNANGAYVSFNQASHAHKDHFTMQVADGLSGLTITRTNTYQVIRLSCEDIKNLVSEGIANRGANYTYEEGATIYPNAYYDIDPNRSYNLYTLRFAVPRKASKTRDEVVSQLVYIIVDNISGNTDNFCNILDDLIIAKSGS